MARPFRKIRGIQPEVDARAIEENRRPFVLIYTTAGGGSMEYHGCSPPSRAGDAEYAMAILQKLNAAPNDVD